MKNRNRGEDGTLATQSVTTFIKNSKVLRGARRKGRSRRKMSQFPTREPFPFAVKTSLRNSSSCKSQSLSLFLFSRSTPANRIVRDRERRAFSLSSLAAVLSTPRGTPRRIPRAEEFSFLESESGRGKEGKENRRNFVDED